VLNVAGSDVNVDMDRSVTRWISSCNGFIQNPGWPVPTHVIEEFSFAASCHAVRQHGCVADEPPAPHLEWSAPTLDTELAALRDQITKLRSENARLLRLLELTPAEARPPGPVQTGIFDTAPGAVHAGSPPAAKVAFYAAMFAARSDVYAVRWENARTGRSGWMPAVHGGWRRGIPADQREYLPLTPEVFTAHLSGELEIGLYPLLDGDRCCWLAADFDGPAAMLDALAYLKAARAYGVPTALEVSRSGSGAHAWLFFTSPVAAALAREIGTGLLREAIAVGAG
jgi:hypothetical protein